MRICDAVNVGNVEWLMSIPLSERHVIIQTVNRIGAERRAAYQAKR